MRVSSCIEVILLSTAFILINNFTEALWLRMVLVGITFLYLTILYRKNETLKLLLRKRLNNIEEVFTRTERFLIILTPLYKSVVTVVLLQTSFIVYSTFIQGLFFSCGIALLVLELRKEYVQEYDYYLK